MSHAIKVRIGTFIVKEPFETTRLYECAAWEKRYIIPAGEYPAYVYLTWTDVSEHTLGHSVYSEPTQCEITHACFVSRIGNCYGRDDGPAMVGTTEEENFSVPTYNLDKYVGSGMLVLDSSVVEECPHESESGKKYIFYRLNKDWKP